MLKMPPHNMAAFKKSYYSSGLQADIEISIPYLKNQCLNVFKKMDPHLKTVVRTMINMIKHYESFRKSCKSCVSLYHLQLKLRFLFF